MALARHRSVHDRRQHLHRVHELDILIGLASGDLVVVTQYLLREVDRAIWDEYVQLERDGIRREAIPVLARLVSRLEFYPPEVRSSFADSTMPIPARRSRQHHAA